jgi:hypothetical protein
VFELVEEALDEVSFAVEGKIAEALDDAVCFGWNNDASANHFDTGNDGITVIALVAEHVAGLDAIQQKYGLSAVGNIAGCQNEPQRIAARVAQGMQFGGQSTARAANGFRLLIPPFAPALCWCARTMVASIMTYSKSGSSAKALKRLSQTSFLDHRL